MDFRGFQGLYSPFPRLSLLAPLSLHYGISTFDLPNQINAFFIGFTDKNSSFQSSIMSLPEPSFFVRSNVFIRCLRYPIIYAALQLWQSKATGTMKLFHCFP